jgi:serine/threonine protein kinase
MDGNLQDMLLEKKYCNGMPSNLIKKIFSQLNSALKIMFDKKLCHGNLKPQNIFFSYKNEKKSDFIIKLCDFGFRTFLNDSKTMKTNCGTQDFMAPEVKEYEYLNEKSDLYSLGIILYKLKTGNYIFEGKNTFEIFKNKQKNVMKKETDDPILNDLIKKLVVDDPDQRLNWDEYFNHPFFNDKNLISLGKYKYEEKIIGKGGFGRVFKGIDENNNPIAIKQIDLVDDEKKETIKEIKNEINIMKIMQKDNKYSIKYIDDIEKDCYYYIIMELCDITLSKKIKEENGLKINIIQIILRQLNKTLKKLIERNIVHKDIKPDNILIKYKDGNKNIFDIKLTDYGLSKYLSKKYDSEKAGDKFYIAPESKNNKLNNKSDLWSIGIMMYQMYFNEFPFENNKLNIKKSGIFEFDDLISKLLVIDHHKRIEWKDYYEHNFFYEMY